MGTSVVMKLTEHGKQLHKAICSISGGCKRHEGEDDYGVRVKEVVEIRGEGI